MSATRKRQRRKKARQRRRRIKRTRFYCRMYSTSASGVKSIGSWFGKKGEKILIENAQIAQTSSPSTKHWIQYNYKPDLQISALSIGDPLHVLSYMPFIFAGSSSFAHKFRVDLEPEVDFSPGLQEWIDSLLHE